MISQSVHAHFQANPLTIRWFVLTPTLWFVTHQVIRKCLLIRWCAYSSDDALTHQVMRLPIRWCAHPSGYSRPTQYSWGDALTHQVIYVPGSRRDVQTIDPDSLCRGLFTHGSGSGSGSRGRRSLRRNGHHGHIDPRPRIVGTQVSEELWIEVRRLGDSSTTPVSEVGIEGWLGNLQGTACPNYPCPGK